MKLEEQVVSLELAKEMKELGFEQESLWYWYDWQNRNEPKVADYDLSMEKWKICSAYTVAELGEMLPRHIEKYTFICEKLSWGWQATYYNFNGSICMKKADASSKTEANARAKMLIYLKKEGLLENLGKH